MEGSQHLKGCGVCLMLCLAVDASEPLLFAIFSNIDLLLFLLGQVPRKLHCNLSSLLQLGLALSPINLLWNSQFSIVKLIEMLQIWSFLFKRKNTKPFILL